MTTPEQAQLQQGLQATRVAAALQSALHRFPIGGPEPLDHKGAHHGFAHVGVGAADHQGVAAAAHGPGR